MTLLMRLMFRLAAKGDPVERRAPCALDGQPRATWIGGEQRNTGLDILRRLAMSIRTHFGIFYILPLASNTDSIGIRLYSITRARFTLLASDS